MKLRILDLFCGAGGAAVGYHRALTAAGFDVDITGVDIKPQKHYPFAMRVADAMTWPLGGYDFIHASPPCQAHSILTRNVGTAGRYPDLVPATRERLQGRLYVIENVPGARLINPVMLCGKSFGLSVQRHRIFESSVMLLSPGCQHSGVTIGVYGNSCPQWFINMHGYRPKIGDWQMAMGIDWMTRQEMSQAIPPAYTEWLGAQIAQVLLRRKAAAS